MCIGKPVDALLADPSNKENRNFSIEFCGGTHLADTHEAVNFVILNEEGTAKGTRLHDYSVLLSRVCRLYAGFFALRKVLLDSSCFAIKFEMA